LTAAPLWRLLVVATVAADGRPLAGPVDGYFLHGSFSFSSGRDSVRMCHLAARPVGIPAQNAITDSRLAQSASHAHHYRSSIRKDLDEMAFCA
jgi:hypothetical protein